MAPLDTTATRNAFQSLAMELVIGHHDGIAWQQREVEFHAFAFQYRIVIEREFILPSVFVAQDIDLLSLGVIGQPAGLDDALHDCHPVRIRDGAFLLDSTADEEYLLAVDPANDHGYIRRPDLLGEQFGDDLFGFGRGHARHANVRSEERRVGKECRFWWS